MPRSRFSRELSGCRWPRPAGELVGDGISKDVLGGPRWRRTSHGFYVPSSSDDRAGLPSQRILDATPLVPPTGAMTGWAAAFIDGVDQLDGLDAHTMRPLPVPITLGRDVGRRRTDIATYTRERLADHDVDVRFGIRVASRDRATFDGARCAGDLAEAVVFVDACAHAGKVRLRSWRRYVDDHPGWTGIAQARTAAGLAEAAARSGWESRLRVFYVVDAGLPRPRVNIPVFDAGGRLLGIADLLDEDAGLVAEFDGQHHRRRSQHREDNVREEAFESAGLTVVRADSLDLQGFRQELARRLRDGHRRGGMRDRSRDRWTTQEPEWWIEHAGPADALTEEELAEIFG
ncbi:MAG: hypothetical protein WKF72_02855 [Nocardioidaceae bacterium]